MWTHRYLFYILGYNPTLLFMLLLILSLVWPLGPLSDRLLCPFDMPHRSVDYLFIFPHILASKNALLRKELSPPTKIHVKVLATNTSECDLLRGTEFLGLIG